MAIMAKMWGLCMLWLQWTKTNILVAKRPQTDTLRSIYGRYKIFSSYPSHFLCIIAQNFKWVAVGQKCMKTQFYLIFCLFRYVGTHMHTAKII